MFEESRRIYEAECLAEEYYTRLMARTVNNRSAKADQASLAAQYFDEMRPYLEKYTSFRLQMYGHLIGLMRFTSVNDYTPVLPYCDEVIRFFRAKPYEARVPLQIFNYQKLICHIQLRQFEEGAEVAEYCLGIMYEGTFNWFKYMELYIQLSFHTGQYDRGAQLLIKVTEHPRFEFLPEHAKETWRIYERTHTIWRGLANSEGWIKRLSNLPALSMKPPFSRKTKAV